MIHEMRKGIISMLLSALFFSIMGVTVKYSGALPLAQKVLFRNLVMFIVVALPLLRRGPAIFMGHRGSRGLLLIRSLFGLTGVALYFYSLGKLNLGDASILNKLSPFFVTLFSVLFLKNKLNSYQAPALLVAFGGALLIIKPQWDLSVLPALAGVAAAITAGAAYTVISHLKGKEAPETVMLWFSGISTLITLPFALVLWETPELREWAALIGTGVFAAAGQYFLTMAYQSAPPSEISIFNYSHILFSLIMGFLVFGEVPDLLSLIGAVLIIGVALFLYWKVRRTETISAMSSPQSR
ncbi:MAG: DMT family transporter [Spirochaetales bacterium]|nr:DMT family transporter [Spirochaetales bacterium]